MRLNTLVTAILSTGATATPMVNTSNTTPSAPITGNNSTNQNNSATLVHSPVAGGCYVGDPAHKKKVTLYGDNWCSGVSSDEPMSVVWVDSDYSCKLYKLTQQVCNTFPLLDIKGLHLQNDVWLYNCWKT